jgi:DNA helicase-2/ATP-dependent DNA helicase PcrA
MPPPSGLTRRPQPSPNQAAASTPSGSRPTPQVQPGSSKIAPKGARALLARSNNTAKSAGVRSGSVIRHPKFGRGTVLRREGDGEDAKLTISFPGYGLKKIVEKYAGIIVNE